MQSCRALAVGRKYPEFGHSFKSPKVFSEIKIFALSFTAFNFKFAWKVTSFVQCYDRVNYIKGIIFLIIELMYNQSKIYIGV